MSDVAKMFLDLKSPIGAKLVGTVAEDLDFIFFVSDSVLTFAIRI